MSKENFIARFDLIIRKLEKAPATYQEIEKFLMREGEIRDTDMAFSRRTLQRDIQDIRRQFGIEIECEKKGDRRYFISDKPEDDNISRRLMEGYQIVNAIESAKDTAGYVLLETRKATGIEHFYGLLYAVKNKKIVSFKHQKFWDEELTDRTVHPLALKESQGRWYLAATDTKDNKFKTFGLDRISDLDISKSKFKEKYNIDLEEKFKNFFGVLGSNESEPQTVELQFNYEQGQFVKTYPLHHSQKILREEEDNVVLQLKIFITYDFVMELLSFGKNVKVLRPKTLIETVKQSLQKTLKLYKK
jgi:predicted DNA-binding transcriptional regulator YafY